MKRICPICKTELKDNSYVKDHGIVTLSYLELIIKDPSFKKNHYELNASYCPKCGHVELWVDFEQYEKQATSEVDDLNVLHQTVAKYASEHQEREEQKRKEEALAKAKKEDESRLIQLKKDEQKRYQSLAKHKKMSRKKS